MHGLSALVARVTAPRARSTSDSNGAQEGTHFTRLSYYENRGINRLVGACLSPIVPLMGAKKGWPQIVKIGHASVTLYRNKHENTASGWIYVLAWQTASGRKREKFADEAAALSEARTKAAQLSAGKVATGDMTSGDRDELQAARQIAGAVPLLAAMQEWAKARELTGANVLPASEAWAARNSTKFDRVTVADAIKRFTAAKEKAGVDVTCSYNKILPSLAEHAGAQMLDSLSARELQAWLDKRYPHPVSRNTARKRIVALWRWSRKQGYLPREVLTEAEQTEFAQEEGGEIGVINAETFGKLLHHIAGNHIEYLAPLVIAGFCGLRRSEVHAQEWADIELVRAFVRVTKAKRNTPSRRIVPLSPAAVEWLMLCPERKGPLCSNMAVDQIRMLGREAGLKLPANCFRHSRISHRVAATGDVQTTGLESGNSPAVIFKHYRELFTKAEGRSWFNVVPNQIGELIDIKKAANG